MKLSTYCSLSVLILAPVFASLQASAEQRFSFTELNRQQNAVEARLNEARRFVMEGNNAASSQFYNYAFELLAQTSTRLDKADARLDRQIEDIQHMTFHLLRSGQEDRRNLEERRLALREIYFEVDRLARNLSRDIEPHIGISMERVRWLMSSLRYLCENATDPQLRARACAELARIEAALERGDLNELKDSAESAEVIVRDGRDDLSSGGRDTGGPQAVATETGARTAATAPSATRPAVSTPAPGQDRPAARAGTARPDSLADETVDWLRMTLEKLCREVTDPELRRRICEMRDELEEAIRQGDWQRVADILNQTRSEILPEVRQKDPELYDSLGSVPVRGLDGEIRYFPADFSQPGIGTRYIGGRGMRLVSETEEFIQLSAGGWDRTTGETREWQFNITPNESAVDDGRKFDFRLEEQRRAGRITDVRWIVLKEGRPVAEGQSESGSATLTESGVYIIRFTGKTDWGSPFQIQSQVEIVL